jgi:iron complex outermembrane receptor protein
MPYANISGSYGSFNTHKTTVGAGTGILHDHWAVDMRLSSIGSDGYIERAATKLHSFYLQGAYYGNSTSVRLIAFGGKEQTYHAWNYATKEEMELYGRRYNSCGYMFTDSTGTAHYYDDQTDNYTQTNAQLLIDHNFTNNLTLNVGLHYTKGDGYYQEYKSGRKFKEYNLPTYIIDGEEVKKSDLVRKKAMDNHFGGGVFALTYKNDKITATAGGGANYYHGIHFGQVLWVKNYTGHLAPNHEYYRNKGTKDDANIYLKAEYRPISCLNIYADAQYRHIGYRIDGNNDKWNDATDSHQQLAVDEKFNFFNPKGGLSWQINSRNRLFASVGVAHKEPTRNNYTDGKLHEYPVAERLIDYEAGYTYHGKLFTAGANIYFMDYKD